MINRMAIATAMGTDRLSTAALTPAMLRMTRISSVA